MTAAGGLDGLPPLRDVIRDASLTARKALGQNFLLDLNITRKIARAGGPLGGVRILEIGPGPGGLTRALLMEGAEAVLAIERDRRFEAALADIQARSDNRLAVVFADALHVDYDGLARDHGVSRIIANLPYNIATPLLIGWLTTAIWPPWFDRLVVMLQLEVAQRLVAAPGASAYGRLSVMAQLRCVPKVLMTLPPQVFTPSPKVSSALVEVRPDRGRTLDVAVADVEAVTSAAFGQRRKMMRSSLAPLGVDTMKLLAQAGIDPTVRAETLSLEEFVRLTRVWVDCRQSAVAGR